ncbi:hypothetical protein LCGC14_2171480 [marine sediment metagenome]|uniref:Uncharacterized protein n=1 Tax=marine sediment metagenome TaxID=412755 RepID=A0A0F9DQ40_9ZZZZ
MTLENALLYAVEFLYHVPAPIEQNILGTMDCSDEAWQEVIQVLHKETGGRR